MKGKVSNPEAILSSLSDQPGKPVVALKPLTIQFPVRFRDVDLAVLSSDNYVYGLVAIILDTGEYALHNVNAYLELGPALVSIETIDGIEYYNFRYEKGQVVYKTKDLICQSALIYSALNEFILKGKLPWYVNYENSGKLFMSAKKHARTSANILPSMMEFLGAYISRKAENPMLFFREDLKENYPEKNLERVPLLSVFYSAPGTVNKLAGAYFSDGVVSALVNPSERVETIEGVLRQ